MNAVSLEVGAVAPAFRLRSDGGDLVSLASLRGKRVVLFFYPEADTPVCTKQACGFGDLHAAFVERDAVVLGISPDPPEALAAFRKKFGFRYALLSDPGNEVSERYGSYGEKLMYGRKVLGTIRSSVIVDEHGRIAGVFRNVRSEANARRMLEELDRLG